MTNSKPAAFSDPMADRWEVALEQLARLGQLKDNWDGDGAAATKVNLLRTAEEWLTRCRHEDEWPAPGAVYTTVAGTIMLEWHLFSGTSIAAHVRLPGSVEVVFTETGAKPEFFVVSVVSEEESRDSMETYGREVAAYSGGDRFSLAA